MNEIETDKDIENRLRFIPIINKAFIENHPNICLYLSGLGLLSLATLGSSGINGPLTIFGFGLIGLTLAIVFRQMWNIIYAPLSKPYPQTGLDLHRPRKSNKTVV